jgi:hypothetical protein
MASSKPSRGLIKVHKYSCTEQSTFCIRTHESMDAKSGDTGFTGVSGEMEVVRVAFGTYLPLQSTHTR